MCSEIVITFLKMGLQAGSKFWRCIIDQNPKDILHCQLNFTIQSGQQPENISRFQATLVGSKKAKDILAAACSCFTLLRALR